MSDIHIRIAIPCFGGLIHAQCARSVMDLRDVLTAHGIKHSLDMELHESLVQRARNNLAHRMLCTQEATHLFFIDADIMFRPMDVIGMIGTGKDLVCGAYPKKTLDVGNIVSAVKRDEKSPMAFAANYAINVLPLPDGVVQSDGGCVPILDAPTGFMLAKRDVLNQIAAANPDSMYLSDHHANRGEAMHALFDCAIREGRYLSEDYLFSRRWQDLGGTVWLFLPAKLAHIGTHVYQGDLLKTFQPVEESET